MTHPSCLQFAFTFLVTGTLVACQGTITGNPPGANVDTPDSGSAAGGNSGDGSGGSAGLSAGGSGGGGSPSMADWSGQEIYAARCVSCHGPSGEGTVLGPELQHPAQDYSTWVVRNGRPADLNLYPSSTMIAFPESLVTQAQLDEMWIGLDSLAQPTTGEGLYADYCANCHGADALGRGMTPNIEDKELGDITEKTREGDGGTDYGSPTYMPAWSTAEISNAELALIADAIAAGL